ncbi:MAG TPA: hypothetical protein VFS43_32860 [Polyangiaceae bacterium]|nr:hypothetical protein [Polyangiaceae bacterium]
MPRDKGERPPASDAQEPLTIELLDEAPKPPAPDEPKAPAAEAAPERRAPTEAAPLAKVAPADKRAPAAETGAPTAPAEVALGAGGGGPAAEGTEGARPPINFNLGPVSGRVFATAPTSSAAEAPAAPPPDPGERARKYLAQAQDDHDRELGLGWGGEVTAAANSGPIRDAAPGGEGQAVIEVELDANGSAVAARVRSASSQPEGWRRVADVLLAALRGRTVKGLQGSRGGRIALRIETRERLPSGSGSVVKHEGLGVRGDLADIGAQKIRTLNVRLERKERL